MYTVLNKLFRKRLAKFEVFYIKFYNYKISKYCYVFEKHYFNYNSARSFHGFWLKTVMNSHITSMCCSHSIVCKNNFIVLRGASKRILKEKSQNRSAWIDFKKCLNIPKKKKKLETKFYTVPHFVGSYCGDFLLKLWCTTALSLQLMEKQL